MATTEPIVHYQKGKDKYSACCGTRMGIRGNQTTTANKEEVTCKKCRKMLKMFEGWICDREFDHSRKDFI